jgi:hypothetical protein
MLSVAMDSGDHRKVQRLSASISLNGDAQLEGVNVLSSGSQPTCLKYNDLFEVCEGDMNGEY